MFLFVNPVFHTYIKHVEVDYHYVHDKVSKKEIHVQLISLKDKLTDVLTKSLSHAPFAHLRSKLYVESLFLA